MTINKTKFIRKKYTLLTKGIIISQNNPIKQFIYLLEQFSNNILTWKELFS